MRRHIARLRESGNLAWSVAASIISLIAIAPVIAIGVLALGSSGDAWPHLIANVLPGALRRTLGLMAGVGALSLLIGTGTAWLVTMYRFPGRRMFEWLLLLPLAVPTYIIAFCYLELFDYSGAVQTALRHMFGWRNAQDYWFPDIRRPRRCHLRDERGALSLCLHHRAGELPRSIGLRARGEPHARPERRRHLLAGGPAARPAGARRRCRARAHGDPQ